MPFLMNPRAPEFARRPGTYTALPKVFGRSPTEGGGRAVQLLSEKGADGI